MTEEERMADTSDVARLNGGKRNPSTVAGKSRADGVAKKSVKLQYTDEWGSRNYPWI